MANFNLNRVILGGRLTSDVELKTTASGVSVCSFTIDVNRRYQSRDSQEGNTADFINCVAWRQSAEFISKYFHKGSSICVEGSIQTRSWTDNNNQKRYVTEVVVDSAMFVDSKSENGGARAPQDQGAFDRQPDYSAPADLSFDTLSGESDLPF